MDIKKEFIEYLVKSKILKKEALTNQDAIQVIGNIVSNPINYIHENGSLQIILTEYDNWYELYCPLNKCISEAQLMNLRFREEITDEEYQIGLSFLAYLRAVIA